MGMFDYVNVDGVINCPNCKEPLEDNWQTKSTDCTLAKVHWSLTANFYNSCDQCGTWVAYTRDPPEISTKKYEGFSVSINHA